MNDTAEHEATEGEYDADSLKRLGAKWIARIRAAEDGAKKWSNISEKAEAAYLAGQGAEGEEAPAWNIVASNVETMVPALYNSTPAPDIRPRHGNKDDLAKQTSNLLERAITAAIDDGRLE